MPIKQVQKPAKEGNTVDLVTQANNTASNSHTGEATDANMSPTKYYRRFKRYKKIFLQDLMTSWKQ